MGRKTWFRQYHAEIETPNLNIIFMRLFEDVRDEMSDVPKPDWTGTDEFHIYCKKVHTTYEPGEQVDDSMPEFPVTYTWVKETRDIVKELDFDCDKQTANMIWKLAKKYDSFETCVQAAMMCNK